MISVSPVRSSSELDDFIRFPWKIYSDLPNWVPPTISSQKKDLDRRKGFFFNDGFGSDAELFLCRDNDEVVGRIAAIRNERHLERQKDGVGFFGFFESIDSTKVAQALFESAEGWLRENGLSVSRGPTSFTINDPAGVTIQGHHRLPSILMAYTPPYYADLIEACGYRKVRDLLGFELSMDTMERHLLEMGAVAAASENGQISIRQIDRSDIESEAELIARVFSESWDRNWGAFPLLAEELVNAAKDLGPLFDERLGYIAYVNSEPAGVFLAIPDPSEILQGLNGKLGWKGALKIWRSRRRVRRIRLLILGTLPEFNSLPIAPLMIREVQKRRAEFPAVETVDLFWVLEENKATRNLAVSVGGELTSSLRIFEKYL